MRQTNTLLALLLLVAAALACRCQPEPPQPPNKAAAVKLDLDGPRLQSAAAPGDRPTYAVEVPAGTSVYLYMVPELGLNLSVEVRDEAGYRVESWNASHSNESRYTAVAFASRLGGSYYVTLSPGGGAGRYYLEAKGGCGGGKLDNLQVLRRGGPTFQAELGDYPNFADYIVETDEQRMVFTVDPDYGLDTKITIYGLDCRQLLSLNNHFPKPRDGLRMSAFEPKFRGRYLVRVATSDGGGKFRINVR